MGTPIVGDGKYGGAEAYLTGGVSRKLHLHARAIRLPHPDGGFLQVHARPPLPLAAPARVLHLGLLLDAGENAAEYDQLAALCRHAGQPEPMRGTKHVAIPLNGAAHLIWEKRTEFSTYTHPMPRTRPKAGPSGLRGSMAP